MATAMVFSFLISGGELSANNGNGNGKGLGPDSSNGNANGHNKDSGNKKDNNQEDDIGGETHQLTLGWVSPTTRTDGSCLNGAISGYKLNYRAEGSGESHATALDMSAGSLSCNQVDYESACGDIVYSCSYTVTDLDPDTWHFSVNTIDADDVMGPESESVTATLP